MDRYGKIAIMIVAFFSSVTFGSISVKAQPIGIMSSQQQKPQHQILSSENGRFVFGQISDSRKDKFMLDTYTGRLWRISESGKIGIYLKPVSYHIADGEYVPIPRNISGPENKKAEN
ncbi:hypothetical protein ACFL7M_06345 [Thermodesulfobacteriota bacterium]